MISCVCYADIFIVFNVTMSRFMGVLDCVMDANRVVRVKNSIGAIRVQLDVMG